MKCSHCSAVTNEDSESINIGKDLDGEWFVKKYQCPNAECGRLILYLEAYNNSVNCSVMDVATGSFLIHPRTIPHQSIPQEVPLAFSVDWKEAWAVLPHSPRASAALSRLCLQNLLRQVARVMPGSLYNEIEQVIGKGDLPPVIVEWLLKLVQGAGFSGNIVEGERCAVVLPVTQGEAELMLDILSQLFEFYFLPVGITGE